MVVKWSERGGEGGVELVELRRWSGRGGMAGVERKG